MEFSPLPVNKEISPGSSLSVIIFRTAGISLSAFAISTESGPSPLCANEKDAAANVININEIIVFTLLS